jgi:LacI family transcriptional regulator
MAVTIRDVAKAAGVSAMAVSKVLHGRGDNVRVGAEKAELIRNIAAEMHYTPNQLARSLRGERKQSIALVIDVFGPIAVGSRYLALLFDGIHTSCFKHGYSLTVCPRLNLDHKKLIADGRFDGIIWAKFQLDSESSALAEANSVKVVHLHVPPSVAPDDVHDYFCCDNMQAMELAATHLAELGHKKIDFIVDEPNQGCAEDYFRYHSLQVACKKIGIEAGQRFVLNDDGSNAHIWFNDKTRASAIILRSEGTATTLYKHANDNNIKIPEDLSIVGFDSTEFSDILSPKLTAIYQPIEQLAFAASEVLISRIENREVDGRHHSFECGFDIRESTAPPKS